MNHIAESQNRFDTLIVIFTDEICLPLLGFGQRMQFCLSTSSKIRSDERAATAFSFRGRRPVDVQVDRVLLQRSTHVSQIFSGKAMKVKYFIPPFEISNSHPILLFPIYFYFAPSNKTFHDNEILRVTLKRTMQGILQEYSHFSRIFFNDLVDYRPTGAIISKLYLNLACITAKNKRKWAIFYSEITSVL